MSGQLIPSNPELKSNVSALATVGQGGGFLPRLQLFTASSDACKEAKIGIAHWGLTRDKNNIEDLGKELEVVVLAGRAKAIEFGDTTLVFYDNTHPEYLRISEESDNNVKGRMYGAEYLVWIPDAETFATCYLCSPTARRASSQFTDQIDYAAILKGELIDNGKNKWHGPTAKRLETPTFTLPPMEDINKQKKKFLEAKDTEIEKAAPAGEGSRER